MLNGLPWKQNKIPVFFEIAPKYCISDSFVDCEGYSVSSKGFFPTVVYIMVIWIKLSHSCHFNSLISKMLIFTHLLLLDHVPFTLIHGPNISGSYAVLFFTTIRLYVNTSHIHNWASFLLYPGFFILFVTIYLLFSSSILDGCWSGGAHILVSYLFALLYFSWGSQGKNTEVACHSLLQWTTFCQNSPSEPLCLRCPCTAWLIVSLSYARLWPMWSFWLAFCNCGFSFWSLWNCSSCFFCLPSDEWW